MSPDGTQDLVFVASVGLQIFGLRFNKDPRIVNIWLDILADSSSELRSQHGETRLVTVGRNDVCSTGNDAPTVGVGNGDGKGVWKREKIGHCGPVRILRRRTERYVQEREYCASGEDLHPNISTVFLSIAASA